MDCMGNMDNMDNNFHTGMAFNDILNHAATHPANNAAGVTTNRQRAYAPQFSATSALILQRIRSTGHEGRPSTQVGNSLKMSGSSNNGVISGKSSTIPLPKGAISQHAGILAKSYRDHIASASSSLKRKRNPKMSVPDFTQNTIFFPVAATSQPAAAGAFAPTDSSAPLDDHPVSSKLSSKPQTTNSLHSAREATRGDGMSFVTNGIVPAKPELVGFFAGDASDVARTQYFMQKKRSDLLNILSFCDQCHPQLLVDIMVSVSKKHPDLPIFDSSDWESRILNSLIAPKAASRASPPPPVGGARHGHAVTSPKARHRQKNAKKALRRLLLAQNEGKSSSAANGGVEEDEETEETLPSTWPKAGQGLYSKLPPETEDRAYLVDDKDDESFSQFMVDRLGKPIVISSCA